MYLLSYMWSYLALITLWCKCFHSSLVDEETKGQRGKKKKKKLPKLSNPGLLNLTVILLQHTIDSSLVPELTSPNRLCLVYVVKANLWSDLAWKERNSILFFSFHNNLSGVLWSFNFAPGMKVWCAHQVSAPLPPSYFSRVRRGSRQVFWKN